MTPIFLVIFSLKTMLRTLFVDAPVELSAGLKVLIVGDVVSGPEPEFVGEAAPVVKSELLWSVSVPAGVLCMDVVLEGAGANAPSKQLAVVPYPTWSTAPPGQLPVRVMLLLTRYT